MSDFSTLQETINKFLEDQVNRDIKQDGTYKPKIIAFQNYLIEQKNIGNRNDFKTELETLNYMDIKDSMIFYIKSSKQGRKKISAKETLKSYLTVIRNYFYFLNNNNISNRPLIAKFNVWENEMDAFIEEVSIIENLRNKKGMQPLSRDKKTELINLCDSFIMNYSFSDEDRQSTKYKFYVSSLILKLLMEIGIKYKVIQTIKPTDIDYGHNEITLHSKYIIPITPKLSEQLKNYTIIREKVMCIKGIKSQELFIQFNEKLEPKENDYVREFLKKIGRSDTTGVSKCRIIEMLIKGIPEILVYELTNYESSVINDCKNYVDGYKEDYSKINLFIKEKFLRLLEDDSYIT